MASVQVSGVVSGRGVFWQPGRGRTQYPHIQVMEPIESPVPGARDLRIWTCRLSPSGDHELLPFLHSMKWVCVTGLLTVLVNKEGQSRFLLSRCLIQLGPVQSAKDDPVYAVLAERKNFNAPRTGETRGDQVNAISLEEDAKLLPG